MASTTSTQRQLRTFRSRFRHDSTNSAKSSPSSTPSTVRSICTSGSARSLEDLFKALLHKLMTGEIRVADLDLSALAA